MRLRLLEANSFSAEVDDYAAAGSDSSAVEAWEEYAFSGVCEGAADGKSCSWWVDYAG